MNRVAICAVLLGQGIRDPGAPITPGEWKQAHGRRQDGTARSRTSLHTFYCRRDKPQQQYQKLLLRPEVQQGLAPDLRHLLALDDPLNDQLSTDVVVRSGFLK
jgi:hypothetical protein